MSERDQQLQQAADQVLALLKEREAEMKEWYKGPSYTHGFRIDDPRYAALLKREPK